jgi:hypothetical protein
VAIAPAGTIAHTAAAPASSGLRRAVGAPDARLAGMRNLLVLATVVAAACASPRPPIAAHPKGYAAHMQAADQHSQRAEEHRQAGKLPDTGGAPSASYQCGDTVMSDQSTSGGERLVQAVPCWNPTEEHADRHQELAEREDQRARDERDVAASLLEAELAACRGLPARELERSPFARREAIASVTPHRDAGKVRGVRIVWKPVRGLTAASLRQSIACHRARFERLGQPATYLPDDPTLVAHATATVTQRGGHLEVTVEAPDDTSATVALERARDLVRSRTAGR